MNGQGIYATWTVIASLLNFGHALRFVAGVPMDQVSRICLGLLIAVLIVYFILENTVFDKYIRFLLTPYIGKSQQTMFDPNRWRFIILILVVIWASIGIITKQNGKDGTAEEVPDQTKTLVKVVLGLACVFMALRTILVVVRQIKRPLGRSGISQISDKPAA